MVLVEEGVTKWVILSAPESDLKALNSMRGKAPSSHASHSPDPSNCCPCPDQKAQHQEPRILQVTLSC